MKLLIALALLWVLWLTNPQRRRRFWIQVTTVVIIVSWILVSPLAVKVTTWGLTQSLPTDSKEPIDAIVVLGRGEALRLGRAEVVRDLWQSQRASKVFASGMLDARPIVDYLKEQGIPTESLGGEECSQSTKENALFTSALVAPQGVHSILLVTDAPHMWRSLLIFHQTGFKVIPYPSPLPSSWESRRQMMLITREYLALAQYTLSTRFNINLNINFSRPPLTSVEAASARIAEWNCKV